MIISVINHTNTISDNELQRVIRAINRQIEQDFEPYWSFGGSLRLEGSIYEEHKGVRTVDMRGDAIVYLLDKVDILGAKGFHEKNYRGVPYGVVFRDTSDELGEDWSVTLSHEALELIGDPEVNLFVAGPHPEERGRTVFHWYEMCDAVQDEWYIVDGVKVSNFVLPLYFTHHEEKGSRNDFLGLVKNGKSLRSFGVNQGGYVGFYDPEKKDVTKYYARGDMRAAKRLEIKGKLGETRRAMRYSNYFAKNPK